MDTVGAFADGLGRRRDVEATGCLVRLIVANLVALV